MLRSSIPALSIANHHKMYKVSDLRETEHALRFEMPVRWSSLLDPAALTSREDKTPVVMTQRAAADSAAHWAMVIPKLAPAAPRLLPAAGPIEEAHFAAPKYLAPKFEVSSVSAPIAVKLVLMAGLGMLLVPGWRNDRSAGAQAVQAESAMSDIGWIRESSNLVLYGPSIGQSASRIDFTWRINAAGVAWVVRAKDAGDYYAVRIKPAGAEIGRAFSVERYTMYRGVEKSRAVKQVDLSNSGAYVRVRMEATGSSFKLLLDGKSVSQWTDTRLPAGAVGFLDGADERPDVQALRIARTSTQ